MASAGPSGSAAITARPGPASSRATCRHAPARERQLAARPLGDEGERDRLEPASHGREERAARSAHIARPSDTFSTSAPGTMLPSAHRTAAPMWKSLYGA